MKKLFAFILAVFYLTSTIGANIRFHYCMDKLINWSLTDDINKNKCNNCGMEKDGGCCKDEDKFVKNKADQTVLENGLQIQQPVASEALVSFNYSQEKYYSSLPEKYYLAYSPPGGVDILIQNCVFRI